MSFKSLNGSCLCGAIKFRIDGQILDSAWCHCSICQRACSSPAVPWITMPIKALQVLSGTPRTFQSSSRGIRQFCADCGSQLTFRYVEKPQTIDITIYSLENASDLKPNYHIWTSSKSPWFQCADGLDQFEGQGPDLWS